MALASLVLALNSARSHSSFAPTAAVLPGAFAAETDKLHAIRSLLVAHVRTLSRPEFRHAGKFRLVSTLGGSPSVSPILS